MNGSVPEIVVEDMSEIEHLEYADYDVFEPTREIDAIIEGQLYMGECAHFQSPILCNR